MSRILTGKILNCLHCNKECYIPNNRLATFKYCSRKCGALFNKIQTNIKCKICDLEFECTTTRANKAKYCSRKCYYKGQTKNGTVIFNCLHCHKEFKGSPSQVGKRKYCSKACVNKESKLTFKPSYTTVRKAMLFRNLIKKCNRCGYNKEIKILGVHHIDRNRNNNKLNNLEILCPNCHSLEHLKHISHGFKE